MSAPRAIIRRALGYRRVRVIDSMEPIGPSSFKVTQQHYEWRRVRPWWRPQRRTHTVRRSGLYEFTAAVDSRSATAQHPPSPGTTTHARYAVAKS